MVKKVNLFVKTALFSFIILFSMIVPVSGGLISAGDACEATALSGRMLVPLGKSAGIKLFAKGVMIVSLAPVETGEKTMTPARDAGLREGDVISKVNGHDVSTAEALSEAIEGSEGRICDITVERDGITKTVKIKPAIAASDKKARIGAWVRDSMAGIGTLTFYDPESGTFGALGHGICDVDTGRLMPLASGVLMPAVISAIKKGEVGSPGELCGAFDLSKEMGTLIINNTVGVYGRFEKDELPTSAKAIPVAARSEIKRGKATILCNIEGEKISGYEIEITALPTGSGEYPNNMSIKVTDKELIEKTGGIIQGMSGSPIIQNGKLIGAVTHVLVNDPLRGYGIYIGAMLESDDSLAEDDAA